MKDELTVESIEKHVKYILEPRRDFSLQSDHQQSNIFLKITLNNTCQLNVM